MSVIYDIRQKRVERVLKQGGLQALVEQMFSTSFIPTRPYVGQPQTFQGVRGKQLIHGLHMRDLCDCVAKAILKSGGVSNPTHYSDLVHVNLQTIDPFALITEVMIEVEKTLGIFPNVPTLYENKEEDTKKSP